MRHTVHYRKQENILEEFDMDPIENKLAQDKQNCLDHAAHLKQLLDYRPSRRKTKTGTSRPIKRLLNCYNVQVEAERLLA
jgi:hypothetical protein